MFFQVVLLSIVPFVIEKYCSDSPAMNVAPYSAMENPHNQYTVAPQQFAVAAYPPPVDLQQVPPQYSTGTGQDIHEKDDF